VKLFMSSKFALGATTPLPVEDISIHNRQPLQLWERRARIASQYQGIHIISWKGVEDIQDALPSCCCRRLPLPLWFSHHQPITSHPQEPDSSTVTCRRLPAARPAFFTIAASDPSRHYRPSNHTPGAVYAAIYAERHALSTPFQLKHPLRNPSSAQPRTCAVPGAQFQGTGATGTPITRPRVKEQHHPISGVAARRDDSTVPQVCIWGRMGICRP
jgi:hypothetical protein